MKLEWRATSDGERWFANVDDGQLIVSRGRLGGWHPDLMLFPDSLRQSAYLELWKSGDHQKAESLILAVEDWYFSKVKADQCES